MSIAGMLPQSVDLHVYQPARLRFRLAVGTAAESLAQSVKFAQLTELIPDA